MNTATTDKAEGSSGSGKPVNAAFMFADVSGSTKLFEVLGDDTARRVVAEVMVDVINIVRNYDGRVIKTIGDEVMCVYPKTDRAVQAASAIHETLEDKFYSNQQVKMRVGVHYGTAMAENTQGKLDFFGDGVNVAARMVAQAKSEQTIVSQDVVDKLPPEMQESCRFVDSAHIKGKHDVINIHEVVWKQEDVTSMAFPATSAATPGDSGSMSVSYGDNTVEVCRAKPSIVIGRSKNCDMPVNEELASRNHVLLELRRDKFFLIDQSTNGTYVLNTANNQSTFLRREEMMLTGNGKISLGRAFDEDPVEVVQYSHSGSAT